MDSIFFRPTQGTHAPQRTFFPQTFVPAFGPAAQLAGPQPQLLALLKGLMGVSDRIHSSWHGMRFDSPAQQIRPQFNADWQAVSNRWGFNVSAIDDAINGGGGAIGVSRGPLALSPSGLRGAA